MKLYYKKPLEVEAVQFTELMARGEADLPKPVHFIRRSFGHQGKLMSHEHVVSVNTGRQRLEIGDFIVIENGQIMKYSHSEFHRQFEKSKECACRS